LETAGHLALVQEPTGKGFWGAFGEGSIDPALGGDYWSDPDYWSFSAVAGDRISVSVDAQGGLDPLLELYNSAGGYLTGDDNGGPDGNALLSDYLIESSGTYF